MVDRDNFCAYALHNDIDFMISIISFAFCSRGMTFLCLNFEFSLLQHLSSLASLLLFASFLLFSNECFPSIRDSCLDQRGALLHFRIQVLCLVFYSSILQSSWQIPQAARIRSFGPYVRSFCVRYFCISLLFSCSNCILHDLFTLYTSLGSLLIIVYFKLHLFIYLFGSLLLYVRWPCLILYNRILSDEDN